MAHERQALNQRLLDLKAVHESAVRAHAIHTLTLCKQHDVSLSDVAVGMLQHAAGQSSQSFQFGHCSLCRASLNAPESLASTLIRCERRHSHQRDARTLLPIARDAKLLWRCLVCMSVCADANECDDTRLLLSIQNETNIAVGASLRWPLCPYCIIPMRREKPMGTLVKPSFFAIDP